MPFKSAARSGFAHSYCTVIRGLYCVRTLYAEYVIRSDPKDPRMKICQVAKTDDDVMMPC